jgi:tetratricopeptide (TPR) repeat protein
MRAVILSRSYHRRLRAATEALMASSARIDELEKKFNENERRYFAPLANEYRKMGDLERAIYICEQFLPQQPGHMSGHIVYGQALFESGRFDDARGVFETALSLDPENLIALRHLGDISAHQGDSGAARRWYERVLEADPRNEEIHGLLAGLSDAHVAANDAGANEPMALPAHDWQEPEVEPSTTVDLPSSAAPAPPELLDLDVALPSASSAAPSDVPSAMERMPDLAEPAVGDIEPVADTSELMPALAARADGFESTEFAAPAAAVEQAAGLQSAYQDEVEGSTPPVAPLAGLESHPGILEPPSSHAATSGLPELDESLSEDDGLVLPPHGDPIVASGLENHEAARTPAEATPAPSPPAPAAALLDFEMPSDAGANVTPPEPDRGVAAAELPRELPPEVIAAEAELIDLGASGSSAPEATPAEVSEASTTPSTDESTDESADVESIGSELSFIDVDSPSSSHASDTEAEQDEARKPEPEPVASAEDGEELVEEEGEPASAAQRPFVTETMAELYLSQGFRTEALAVYEQLSAANPGDARLIARVTELRIVTIAPPVASGPPVREFFARLAARRPGERAAASAPPAEDDFASAESSDWGGPDEDDAPRASAAYAEPVVEPDGGTADEASGGAAVPEQDAGAGEQRAGGSIDALFGNKPATSTEDSAASALAQAFGGDPDIPSIAGNPTRPATGELSLDSVFRDGTARGPRTSQGFSFDQFFSQNPEGERTSGGGRGAQDAPAEGEPAERTADDIEQFNAWLQGLKQR